MQEKHPEERKNCWDEKHLALPRLLLNTWKLILVYSVAAWLSAKPSLQEGLASRRGLKDNRSCWFFHNAWTGNELLSETPIQLVFGTAVVLSPSQGKSLKIALQHICKKLFSQQCNLSPKRSLYQNRPVIWFCLCINLPLWKTTHTHFKAVPHCQRHICRTQMVIRTQIWPLCRLCHF